MEMLEQGLGLMVIGMGVVFAFLLLLVGCLHGLGAFFARHGHRFPDPAIETAPVAGVTGGAGVGGGLEAAAVAVAAAFQARCTGSGSGSR